MLIWLEPRTPILVVLCLIHECEFTCALYASVVGTPHTSREVSPLPPYLLPRATANGRAYHPKRCFHFEIQWFVATGAYVGNFIRKVRSKGVSCLHRMHRHGRGAGRMRERTEL